MKTLGSSNESFLAGIALAMCPSQLEVLEDGCKRLVAVKPEGIERPVPHHGVTKENQCLEAPREIGMLQRLRGVEKI